MRYRFGQFELDTANYELLQAGRKLAARPKVFDILRHLIEHRETLVTKDELLDAVWPGQQVAENAVPWTMGHVRRLIGQPSRHNTPIETVHGRGYRWSAAVTIVEPPTPTESAAVEVTAPFVGRDALLDVLQARLEEVEAGRGALCVLTGEAGIGKTRCIDELALHARRAGFAVWSGRALEDAMAPVFFPWIQLLREALYDGHEHARELLRRLSAASGRHEAPRSNDRELALGKLTLFDDVGRFVRDSARQVPSLLVLDDLHSADRGTLELLAVVAPELRKARVLVVAAARVLPWAGKTQTSGLGRFMEHFELEPLRIDDVEQYVRRSAGIAQPKRDLCQALLRVSAGNPLFLQESLTALTARHGRAALATLPDASVEVSPRMRDVLRARISELDPETQRTLAGGSIFGERFEAPRLARLLGQAPPHTLQAIERACAARVLESDGANHYRFRHALLRAAAYELMDASERVSRHRAAAILLEAGLDAAMRRSEIAHHYHLSLALGEPERVATAARRAGETAMRAQAFADAARFFAWAIEAVELGAERETRVRAELLLERARAERFCGNGDDARATVAHLIDVASAHGYADLLVRAARVLRPSHAMGAYEDPLARTALESALQGMGAGERALRAQALSQLACIPPAACDLQRSQELSAQALELARSVGEREVLAEALTARLYGYSGPDDIAKLLEVSDEMLRLDRDVRGWISVEAHVARHAAFNLRFDVHRADAELAALSELARSRGLREIIWHCDRMLAQRSLLAGDLAKADAEFARLEVEAGRLRLNEARVTCQLQTAISLIVREGPYAFGPALEPGFFDALPHSRVPTSYRTHIGRLALNVGQPAPASALLEELSAADFAGVSRDVSCLQSLCNLALIAIGVCDQPRVSRLYSLLSPYADFNTPNSMGYCEGAVSHFLALLAGALGHEDAAREHFTAAIASNARLGRGPLLARTHYEFAVFLTRRRDPLARTQRSLAIESCERAGLVWLAERARALPLS